MMIKRRYALVIAGFIIAGFLIGIVCAEQLGIEFEKNNSAKVLIPYIDLNFLEKNGNTNPKKI